jgi:hypothetical protein
MTMNPEDVYRLEMSAAFSLESFKRTIDAETDINRLKHIAKKAAEAFFLQQAATKWVINQTVEYGRMVSDNDPRE